MTLDDKDRRFHRLEPNAAIEYGEETVSPAPADESGQAVRVAVSPQAERRCMGLETKLFEIDARSRLFEMLREDGNWAQHVALLAARYSRPESCLSWADDLPELYEEVRPFVDALEAMLAAEPRLASSRVDLHKDEARFRGPLQHLARDVHEWAMVRAIFEGERYLAPRAFASQGVQVKWIDAERSADIARWLGTLGECDLYEAALMVRREKTVSTTEPNEDDEEEGKIQHEVVRELQALFAATARAGNAVVVIID